MKKSYLLLHLVLALTLSACNLPLGGQTPPPASAVPLPGEVPSVLPSVDAPGGDGPTLTPAQPQPTVVPTSAIPDGWSADQAGAVGVTFYRPDDWEQIAVNDLRFELRPSEGFAWLEVNVITPANDDDWGLTYQPGQAAKVIIETLIAALQEDGAYDEPSHVVTPDGRTAWATQGTNDLIGDHLFIGVIGYADRALIVTGHDSGEEGQWADLLNIYQTIFASIAPTDG